MTISYATKCRRTLGKYIAYARENHVALWRRYREAIAQPTSNDKRNEIAYNMWFSRSYFYDAICVKMPTQIFARIEGTRGVQVFAAHHDFLWLHITDTTFNLSIRFVLIDDRGVF